MGVELCLAAVNTRLRNSVPHAKSAVGGSLLLRSGTIEGKVRGGFVTGVVKDESGEIAATFTGRVNPDGTMSGTYTESHRGGWLLEVAGLGAEWAGRGVKGA